LYEIEQVVPLRLLDASELVLLQSNPASELGNNAAGIVSQPYAMEQLYKLHSSDIHRLCARL